MSSQRTKFYRDKQNSKLMGVCSGLADYTGIEAIWWRLFFVVLTLTTGFGIPIYFVLGLLADKKPAHLYTDDREKKYWQRVRQSPTRTAREVRSQFRDIDRRLADVESYYVHSNPRLSAEIENLR
ncbi:envelope stress response membrane protein PspC [Altericroceibacterium endophyticum]|uniref:Envelope stress response membrane protein PspC n=1 Tax=Altericroceibacterium endophyticum TaxID=1808508 RepID=A0A6I4T4Y3_9SPHN|nr:envelope stress response membrane protein PspC [Altericroceibacterium endophyticum]MXO66304.1 envelope stress response membrane protein PspC [Altericroceibacterium endophyticum]